MNTDHLTTEQIRAAFHHATSTSAVHLRVCLEALPNPPATAPKLIPIADMPKDVPEGCARVTAFKGSFGRWEIANSNDSSDTHYCDILLPDPVDTEREAFEAWWGAESIQGLVKDKAWLTWQAARKASQP